MLSEQKKTFLFTFVHEQQTRSHDLEVFIHDFHVLLRNNSHITIRHILRSIKFFIQIELLNLPEIIHC